MLKEEGFDNVVARHHRLAEGVRRAVAGWGLKVRGRCLLCRRPSTFFLFAPFVWASAWEGRAGGRGGGFAHGLWAAAQGETEGLPESMGACQSRQPAQPICSRMS